MEMQTNRQSGLLHINMQAASILWFRALNELKDAVKSVEEEESWRMLVVAIPVALFVLSLLVFVMTLHVLQTRNENLFKSFYENTKASEFNAKSCNRK